MRGERARGGLRRRGTDRGRVAGRLKEEGEESVSGGGKSETERRSGAEGVEGDGGGERELEGWRERVS